MISTPFIHRPIATTLVMLGILLFGVIAYRQLPVSDATRLETVSEASRDMAINRSLAP